MRVKGKKKSRVCQGDLSQDTVFNQTASAFRACFWDSVRFDDVRDDILLRAHRIWLISAWSQYERSSVFRQALSA